MYIHIYITAHGPTFVLPTATTVTFDPAVIVACLVLADGATCVRMAAVVPCYIC